MGNTSAFIVAITLLSVSMFLSALSMKGIHQWGCYYNWSTGAFFGANLGNNLLFGIPGMVGWAKMKDFKFDVRKAPVANVANNEP
jgi:hypothetical protein